MFPFSFKANFSFDTPISTSPSDKVLIAAFANQFVDSEIRQNTIQFRFFKTILKRHEWLDEGSMTLTIQDNKLNIDLYLSFAGASVLYILLSVLFIILQFSQIHVAISLIAILWAVHGLAYLWTVITFNSTIKKVVKNTCVVTL